MGYTEGFLIKNIKNNCFKHVSASVYAPNTPLQRRTRGIYLNDFMYLIKVKTHMNLILTNIYQFDRGQMY